MSSGSMHIHCCSLFFFFNDTATTEIYTLSLHDALPISARQREEDPSIGKEYAGQRLQRLAGRRQRFGDQHVPEEQLRSEEHTSELQSPCNLVCRLLLEKKKK